MVTMPRCPQSKVISWPRSLDKVTVLPASAEAAVTPIASTSCGQTGDLLVEPDLADLDLVAIGLLVQPTLAARLVLEVLHRSTR